MAQLILMTMSDIRVRLGEVAEIGKLNWGHGWAAFAGGGVSWVGEGAAPDSHGPLLGTPANVFPVKLSVVFRGELVVQRQRIVVVAQNQRVCW